MAPTQPSEPGGGEPSAAGRPDGFEHQQYEHDIPGSDLPFVGPILDVAEMVLDTTQRTQLAEGVAMRPAGQIPHTNAAGIDHPELKQLIDVSKAAQVHELGQMWNDLGNEIMDFGASLQRTVTSSEAIWAGQAGNAARATLSGLATWSQHTGQGVQYMGTTMRSQAEAAETAKISMPEPVPYEPAVYRNQLNSTINPFEWVQIIGDAREQYERHNAAHEEAIRVTETYSTSLHDTNGTMPAFAAPQEFGNGDTGLTPGGPMPGGTGGGAGGGPGGIPPGAPGTGSRTPGNGGGLTHVAPPTPGQVAPQAPIIPSDSGRTTDRGPDGGGRTGVPGFLPTPAAGIDGPGAGGHRPGTGSRPGGGRAGPGVGGGRGGGGGFGPRGSGGLGASDALGRGALSSPGAAENATGAGRGAAGVAGRGLGAGGAFPPMAGAGRGQGGDDTEHRRPTYLVETEDIWGDGRRVAPPVIGEDPPEYYR